MDTHQPAIGDHVLVRTASGAEVERIVVGYSDEGPLFSTEEEVEEAKRTSREPRGIGWPEEHILYERSDFLRDLKKVSRRLEDDPAQREPAPGGS